MKLSLTPAQAGFIKGIGLILLAAAASYLADSAHLTGVVSPIIATIIAGLASSYESYLKSKSDNTTALFGAIAIKK